MTTFSHSAYAKSEGDLKQKINNIKVKEQNNTNELKKIQSQLKVNKQKQDNIEAQVNNLEHKILQLKDTIKAKEDKIHSTQVDIKKNKRTINTIMKRIESRDKLIKERVRSYYVKGAPANLLEILFNSKSFSDLISRAFAINAIVQADQRILQKQKDDKASLEQEQQSLTTNLKQLNDDLEMTNELKKQVDKQIAIKESFEKKLKTEASELEQLAMSKQEEADLLASQKIAAQASLELWKSDPPSVGHSQKVSKSILSWPTEGSVTSGYGSRWGSFHQGIDISTNDYYKRDIPIRAAADGVVARSYRSSSYGNVVFLSSTINGQLYTTVYAHMKYLPLVNAQETVKRGQVIGYMGQTGEVTGPHLHFEVYKGPWTSAPHPGTVNPLNYLP